MVSKEERDKLEALVSGLDERKIQKLNYILEGKDQKEAEALVRIKEMEEKYGK